jgi:hypothetical protein
VLNPSLVRGVNVATLYTKKMLTSGTQVSVTRVAALHPNIVFDYSSYFFV